MNGINCFFIRVDSRFIRAHSRSLFFNANGREYPQIFANRIL
jgi:hypothetical protein